MKKNSFYQNTGFGWWSAGDVAETLRVPGGGDSTKANLVVETLVFDEGQITCPENGNRPTWGAMPHNLRERRTDGRDNQGGT